MLLSYRKKYVFKNKKIFKRLLFGCIYTNTLLKKHCHSQLRLQFSYRVTSLWNCLPEEVMSAPSLNAFKARLDNYWDS